MNLDISNIQKVFDVAIEFIVTYSFQILGGIIILIIGVSVARWISRWVIIFCQKKNLDITLSKFFGNVVKILVLTFVIIITLGQFGISIAPFIAALGAVVLGA